MANAFDPERIAKILMYFAAMAISLIFHEMAHAWTAYLRGDSTAANLGRLRPNPLVHLDLIGSILLPLFGAFSSLPIVGWAKPVPVNTGNLKHPRRDHLAIALAGPFANLFLCALATVLLVIFPGTVATPFLTAVIVVNAYLGVFNLLPLPPLDGSTLITSLLPAAWGHSYYRYLQPVSMLLLFVLLSRGGLGWIGDLANAYMANVHDACAYLRTSLVG